MTWTTFFAENAFKATVLLTLSCGIAWWLRRRSASLRHFLWTASFAALLGLPAAVLVLPEWGPPVPSEKPAAVATPQTRAIVVRPANPAPPATKPRVPQTLLLVYLAGCLLAASRYLLGVVRTSHMVRRARPAEYAQHAADELRTSLALRHPVPVFESKLAPMPLTWGIVRPVIVLPAGADTWPAARLRTVLLHELIHVSRRDLLAQAIARAASSLFWFQPLTWLGLAQLRKERERACDDAVLLHGIAPHDYAAHLVELVRSVAGQKNRWAEAPAMAESSDLESRVRAMLDRATNRSPVSARAALAIAAAMVAVLAPLAALHAQAPTGILAGAITDPSGARVPNVRVTARHQDGSNQEVAVANLAGEYRFLNIPAGQYTLEFSSSGFALTRIEAVVPAGGAARADGRLALGSVMENVVVKGQKPAALSPARPSATPAERIRVGGMVTPVRLIRQPRPEYPAELQQLGVEGTVIISAIVSKDGSVLNPRVRNTVDPRLANAALDAVRKWAYEPSLLNGEPVETLTTITLEFQLGQ